MKSNTRIVAQFKGCSTEDCSCKYCLYYAGKSKPCPLERCCCEDERAEAAKRERAQTP